MSAMVAHSGIIAALDISEAFTQTDKELRAQHSKKTFLRPPSQWFSKKGANIIPSILADKYNIHNVKNCLYYLGNQLIH